MRALLPLAAYAAAQAAPRYTLRVSYDGKEKALVLYPGVEPADAAKFEEAIAREIKRRR